MSDTEQQLTPQEIGAVIKSREVRASRAHALSQCDWTQVPDAPLTAEQKQAWLDYRQALRDLPTQAGFPWDVQWPSKPA